MNNLYNYIGSPINETLKQTIIYQCMAILNQHINQGIISSYTVNNIYIDDAGKVDINFSITTPYMAALVPLYDYNFSTHIVEQFGSGLGGTDCKCSKCGLYIVISEDGYFADYNLSCDEMVIKDIVE